MQVLNQFGITQEVLASQENQSVESKGGNFTSLIKSADAAGSCVLRFVEYMEVGTHTSKGKFPKTGRNIILGFEVLTPRHTKLVERDEKDGGNFTATEMIRVTTRAGTNPKSVAMNFFKRMDYGRGNINFAQMLGEAFRAEILITMEDDGKTVKFANLHDGQNGVYTIGAPMVDDYNDMGEKTGTRPINVPEPTKPIRCLLWDSPNQAMWDSVFIDGTYKDKDDVEHSKNWIQNRCFEAEDYQGSPIQQMFGGAADLPGMVEATPVQQPAVTQQQANNALDALGQV